MKVKRLGILTLVGVMSLATTSLFYTNNKVSTFIESTDSCDNVFGKSYLATNDTKLMSLTNLVKPKLGYQYAYTDTNSDGINDYVSIRFTAAIRSLDCNCTWTRALYDENGSVYTKLKEKEVEAKTGYTGVTSNEEVTYATSVEDENGDYPYNYFVVYTLLNIPLDTYSNYYLDCMLTVSDDTNSISSSVGALKVDLTDLFSYEKTNDLTFEKEGDSFGVKTSLDKEEISIPEYASNGDYRLPVTKVLDGAFSNKEELKRVIAKENVKVIEDTFTNSSLFEGFYSNANYGDLTLDDSIVDRVYYYSEECKNYNAWHYVGNTISTEYEHNPKEAVVENDTATCSSDGTKDLVIYCDICGKELSRETVVSYAKGHNYIESVEVMNGHSHTKHECSNCHDMWYDNLVVDYTKNYDYIAFDTLEEYSEYSSGCKEVYEDLYNSCMRIWNNTETDLSSNSYVASDYHYIDATEIGNLVSSFRNSNPQFYFLGLEYSIWGSGIDRAVRIKIDPAFYEASVRKEIQDSILLFEKDFTSRLTADMTDYDKALLIHDYLCENNFYQYDTEGYPDSSIKSHTIWGIVDMDSTTGTVCEGYAKTYQYLSNLIGIETITVAGVGGEEGNTGGHAWNYTKINGAWYGVDVTWDDQTSYTFHDFFLCSASFLAKADSWGGVMHIPGFSDYSFYRSDDPSSKDAYFQVKLPELSEYNYVN